MPTGREHRSVCASMTLLSATMTLLSASMTLLCASMTLLCASMTLLSSPSAALALWTAVSVEAVPGEAARCESVWYEAAPGDAQVADVSLGRSP